MHRVLSLVALLAAVSWMHGGTDVHAQKLGAADRAPRFYLASAGTRVLKDASGVPVLRQRVSVALSRVPLGEALEAISSEAKLRLVYSRDILPAADIRVSLKAEDITITAALTEILLDTGLDVVISTAGQMTLVKRPTNQKVDTVGAIIGLVTDLKTGKKVAGVEVFLEDTRWRTVTDTSGYYHLADIDAGTYTLIVRRVGYTRQNRQVTVRAEREDTVNFALEPVAVALDELITTATGQQRRRDLGNAITTIDADSVLGTAPIRNLTDLLEDRVPGLTVQHTSGAPGDPARLRLRGLGSVLRGNDPVVIVDGIRVYSDQSEARSGSLTNLGDPRGGGGDNVPAGLTSSGNIAAPSPLDQIDPNIIEKIEVFKGPSAATLYGVDAANGVIVITTKKGRPGPPRWNASVAHGRTSTPGQWPEGYFRWGHSPAIGFTNRFCTIVDLMCEQDSLVRFQALNEPDLTILDQGRRTSLSLTASGGSQALTYSVTGTYADEMGGLKLPAFEVERFRSQFNREPADWMKRPHHYKTWSVTSSVRALLGSAGDVTLFTSVTRSEQQRSTLENQVARLAGAYVDRVNNRYYLPGPLIGTQTFGGFYDPPTLSNVSEFLGRFYQRTTASTITFTTSLNANWRPRSWLDGRVDAGLNIVPRDDQLFQPPGLASPVDSGTLIRGTGRSIVGTFNLQGSLRKQLGLGFVFTTSIGTNIVTKRTDDLISSANTLVPGTSSINGARYITSKESRLSTSSFGWYIEPRVTGQRLSLSAGLRLDGGSAHGTRLTQSGGIGNLLSLPKLNGSWVISEEPWFPFTSIFSSLRLRGAYGQAQVQPGPGDRLRLYTNPQNRTEELLLSTLGNAELKPERSVEFEGGIDADLLDSRISLEVTAYRKTQIDALMSRGLPISVNGGGVITQNIGNIRNAGLEVTLGITPIQSPALTWSARLNYSRNANTLVKLGDGVEQNKLEGIVEGYPLHSRWTRPILGYTDQDGDGVLRFSEVRLGDSLVFMGRLYPAYTTSLFTNVALFGGTVGITAGFSYESGATQVDETARTNWVLARALADPSTPLNEQAAIISMDSTEYGLTQDVSTFRFNSVSISYRAPMRIVRLLGAQQMRIAVQGSNLGLHSTYRGKDPDVTVWSSGETIRDTGQLPLPRTWQMTVYLQY